MTTATTAPRKSAASKPAMPTAPRAQRVSLDMVEGQSIVTYHRGDLDAKQKAFARIVRAMKHRKPRSGTPTASQLLAESRNRFGHAG